MPFKAAVAVVVLVSVAIIAVGAVSVYRVESGVSAVATVDDCVLGSTMHGVTYDCTGSWVLGGPVLAGGQVVVGPIVGAGPGDLHREIAVRVSGGTAYVRSLTGGIGLIAFGAALLMLPVSSVIVRRSRARKGTGPAG